MTVATSTARVQYAGNGSTTVFTVPFYFLENAHLRAVLTADGTDTELVLDTEYTVSGAGGPTGGTVTCSVAPASGATLTILREMDFLQNQDYVPNDPFPAESHERALDRLTMQDQQMREMLQRAALLPSGMSGPLSLQPEANLILGWNSSASGLVNVSPNIVASGAEHYVDSIVALKGIAAPATDSRAVVVGYYTPGDGGGGLFWWDSASTATDDGGMVIQLSGGGTGRWKRITNDIFVEHFGAKGNNSTINDIAFANAMAATIEAGKRLNLGPGIFRISSAISIGQYTEWAIKGDTRGGTIIRQVTDNTPIITITGNTSWGWSITDLALDWTNAQPSTNTGAIGIYVDGTTASQQVFHFLLDRVTFDKGYLALASNSAKQLAVWGFEVGQMLVNSSMSGGAIRLMQSAGWGQPSIRIRQLYMRCDAMTLPPVQLNAANGFVIDSLEANIITNLPMATFTGGCSGKIGECKMEVGTYTAASGACALQYSDTVLDIGNLIVGQVTCNVGAGNKFHVLRKAGGGASKIHIEYASMAVTTLTSGTPYIVSDTGSDSPMTIDRFGNRTNLNLTDPSATGAADNLHVVEWARTRMGTNVGDADKTLVMGNETIQRWGTTLTANRTVTLPVHNGATGCDAFNGAWFRILRDAATPGAFTLTILNASAATLHTIASGTKQSVLLMWDRTSGGAWRVVDVATL